MKKRDYRLVIGGKYNMKAIMQRAWVYVRNYNYSLKSAMRMSWADARDKMKDAEREIRFQEAVKTNTLFRIRIFLYLTFIVIHAEAYQWDTSPNNTCKKVVL
ncbi:MAG: hypothetical protein ACLS4S_03660 [Bacteroides nordii]